MRLSESHTLPVPLDEAWAALNDVDVLHRALPGCESLVQIAENEFVAEVAVALGLTTSHLTVYVNRCDVQAPRRCTLHFEAHTERTGGEGDAVLMLVPAGTGASTLHADISWSIEGVIGVLGSPLLELAAHEMASQFFQGLRALAVARHARARIS